MKNLRTIILAAGKGTRMKSDTPKVLHTICGKTILRYILDIAESVGSLKTYVVLGHKNEKVEEHLPKECVSVLQKQLKGTADAVKTVGRYFKSFRGNVLILCGDTPLLNSTTVKTLVRRHKKTKSACTFLTTVVHNPHGYGRVIRDEGGKVVAIREDKDAIGLERNIAEINVGVYCFKAIELFKALKEVQLNKKKKEFYLTDLIEQMKDKELGVETIEAEDATEGLGVNTREDLSAAEGMLRKRILRDFMLQGVTIIDPQSTYIDTEVKIGSDTIIRPFTYIESGVRIGSKCVIGPFARLREGTKIGNRVEVGNFAEISRSKIGNKTLVKHFSFLGDANIGSNVNIGAGTVTANYDGENKNVTRISDHAFIGSDSILIAPVRVGKKAVTAAGSVVPKGKSIPDGGVAMGIPANVTSRRRRK